MTPEELWRAALHDFNNLMAGLQGVVDLTDPARPMDPRNRMRMEAALEEGKTLIGMARALALGRLPDEGAASWPEWAAGLRERLAAMGDLFRCPIEVVAVRAGAEPWPAPLLQEWTVAFTRQLLPWAAPGPLRLEAEADAAGWTLRWITDAPLPPGLRPDPPPDAPRNLYTFWLRSMAAHMGLDLRTRPGALEAYLPHPSRRS